MDPAWTGTVVELLGWGVAATAVALGCRHRATLALAATRLARRVDPRRPAPTPEGRPLEQVASDVRRLGLRFHSPQAGLRFAKYEGLRQAYDKMLAEACNALDIAHLLGVLPPGDELDDERTRVERRLEAAGLRLSRSDA